MNYPVVVLVVPTAVTGLRAAWLWYQSSKVATDPAWAEQGLIIEPGDAEISQLAWIAAMLKSAGDVASLNKTAAQWTAASVVLGAATSIAGALG